VQVPRTPLSWTTSERTAADVKNREPDYTIMA
jgi:hypothetical protein